MNRRYDDYIRLLEEKDMNNKEAYASVIEITQRIQYQIQLLRYYNSNGNAQAPNSKSGNSDIKKSYNAQIPTSSTEATIIGLYDDNNMQEEIESQVEDEALVTEKPIDNLRIQKALPTRPCTSTFQPTSFLAPPSNNAPIAIKRLTRSKKPLPSTPLTTSVSEQPMPSYLDNYFATSSTTSLATTSSAIPAPSTITTASKTLIPSHPSMNIAPSSSVYSFDQQHPPVMMINTQKKRKKQYLGLFFTESYQIENYIITRKKLGAHLYRAYHHLTGQPKIVLKLLLIVIDPYTFHIAYNTQQNRRQQTNHNIPMDEEIPLLVPDEQIKATILEWISYSSNSFSEHGFEPTADTIIFRENNKIYVIY